MSRHETFAKHLIVPSRHSCGSRNPEEFDNFWIPVVTGMTVFLEFCKGLILD